MRKFGSSSWRRCASASASCNRRPARGTVSRSSPARQVTQTYKVATISPDSDKVPWGAAGADGSIAAKARRWMATAQGGTQTFGERTCTPFDQLSHSGTPRPEWRIRQATAGFLAYGALPAPPSRGNDPVVLDAGFPLTVA